MRRWTILLIPLLLMSCRKDASIKSYTVPKEMPATMNLPMAMPLLGSIPEGTPLPPGHPPIDGATMNAGPVPASSGIQWKVPAGWEERTPSAMRVGSFLVKGANGQQADMSIVPLAGEAGGDLANVNRWRGQIGLDPVNEADLSRQSEWISPRGRRMFFVEFAHSGKRMMAAIYRAGERTWFFKMMGDDTVVAAAKPAFIRFLQDLTFSAQAAP